MNSSSQIVLLFKKLSEHNRIDSICRKDLAHSFDELCKVYNNLDICALIQILGKIFVLYNNTRIETLIRFMSLISNMETPMLLFIKSIDLIETIFSIKMILKKDYDTDEKEWGVTSNIKLDKYTHIIIIMRIFIIFQPH